MERFLFEENGLVLVMEVSSAGEVRLMRLGTSPDEPGAVSKADKGAYRMVQMQNAGMDQAASRGMGHLYTQPGTALRYLSHQDVRTPQGRKVMITQTCQDLYVTSYYQFYTGIQALRCWTVVRNTGRAQRTMQHLSSFALTGLDRGAWQNDRLSIARNSFGQELRWRTRTLADWGLEPVPGYNTSARIARSSCGTWTSGEYLPVAVYENEEYAMAWQIEHNGSWMWEIAPQAGRLSLQLSGPSFQEGHWLRPLGPGESFTSIPVAVSFGAQMNHALQEMTCYRRAIRRPNEDNLKLPVVYSDRAANSPDGPRADRLPALIRAAAGVGCEIYCIDAGWFAAEAWWRGVGEWRPSTARFPGGLSETVRQIRDAGMLPGLWLEIEAMGVECPIAEGLPKSWFFQIDGVPLIDHGRYQLDFRNPEVVGHADRVIDRLIAQEGIHYLKMAYNLQSGAGTTLDAASTGDGLLEHTRAYLAWLDRVLARYPWLTIENSAAGGQRMDYALLSRLSLQNVTDQQDARRLSRIAAAAPSALTPEQAGLWCCPSPEMTEPEFTRSLINGLMQRMILSVDLPALAPLQREAVQQAIDVYRALRADLPQLLPFWPLGLTQGWDGLLALGLRGEGRILLTLWRDADSGELPPSITLDLPGDSTPSCACLYPAAPQETALEWRDGMLTVQMPPDSARLIEILW